MAHRGKIKLIKQLLIWEYLLEQPNQILRWVKL